MYRERKNENSYIKKKLLLPVLSAGSIQSPETLHLIYGPCQPGGRGQGRPVSQTRRGGPRGATGHHATRGAAVSRMWPPSQGVPRTSRPFLPGRAGFLACSRCPWTQASLRDPGRGRSGGEQARHHSCSLSAPRHTAAFVSKG